MHYYTGECTIEHKSTNECKTTRSPIDSLFLLKKKGRENSGVPDLPGACFSSFRICYCSKMQIARARTGDCCDRRRLQKLFKIGHISSPKILPRLPLHFSFHVSNKQSCGTYFEEIMCIRVLWMYSAITNNRGSQLQTQSKSLMAMNFKN